MNSSPFDHAELIGSIPLGTKKRVQPVYLQQNQGKKANQLHIHARKKKKNKLISSYRKQNQNIVGLKAMSNININQQNPKTLRSATIKKSNLFVLKTEMHVKFLKALLVTPNPPNSYDTIGITTKQCASIGTPVQACAVDNLQINPENNIKFNS
jgi:hypothetical protein